MADTRRFVLPRRAVEVAERRSAPRSLDPNEWGGLERKAVLRQARETVERVERLERTTDAGWPKR